MFDLDPNKDLNDTADDTEVPEKTCTMTTVYERLVDSENCVTQFPVEQSICSGTCDSAWRSSINGTDAVDCKCCQPAGFKTLKRVVFLCESHLYLERDLLVYTGCRCSSCK